MPTTDAATTDAISVHGTEFHLWWLRDNCHCPECRHPTSFQKLADLSDRRAIPRPSQVRHNGDTLVIEWNESPPHRSVFPVRWLAAHAADNAPGPSGDEISPVLWDAGTWVGSTPVAHDLLDCDIDAVGPWADHLVRYGFALLDNVTHESLDRFAAALGPVLNTEFGRSITLRAKPGATDLAETGHALSPHTDYSVHTHLPPLLQFMLFAENGATGGESILVDGISVAESFRAEHPDHFAMLRDTAVNFQQFYTNWRYFLQRSRPVLEVSGNGGVSGVFFAHSHACNWALAPAEADAYYAAYNAFFRYLKDPANQLRTRIEPGQCVAMRNGRLLHGRTAFDPASGPRTVIDVFIGWEYFEARRRFHRRRSLYVPDQDGGGAGPE